MANENTDGNSATENKQVAIQKIYLKDSSFEAPNTPSVFGQEWKPHVNLNISTKNQVVGEGAYEVVLTITAEASIGEQTAFLCEIHQAGVFVLQGLSDDEMKRVLGSFCPNQLYPYARETVSDLVGKGGFPNLMLQPIDFNTLLEHHQREVEKAQTEAEQSPDRH